MLSLVVAGGCGTDAEGTAECRAFERVRCQAAVACGYPDVDECIRYERDQCLHGVAIESITAAELDGCAEQVAAAGRCAAGQGPDTPAVSCGEPVQADSPTTTCAAPSERPRVPFWCPRPRRPLPSLATAAAEPCRAPVAIATDP
jgi:hypothetical protein